MEWCMAGRQLLIVEDNADAAHALSMLLELHGYTCEVAASAAEMRLATSRHPFDVVLLDLNLPDGDGYTLANHLRTHSLARRIVAVTGKATAADAQRCLAAGFDAHVPKPIEFDRLLAAIG
jgi:CheY-like chemotaxis protein